MSFDPSALLQDFEVAQLEALVETMLLAADADGEVSDEELEQLATSIRALAKDSLHEPAFGAGKLEKILQQASRDLATQGRAARLAAVKERLGNAAACKAALGMAVAVTTADGIVRTTERELIMELADALELDRDEAANMVREITRT